MNIQRIRYRDILDYRINIPEELLQYTIPKLTLQPLVENAILHGINRRRGEGMIAITAQSFGPLIEIKISDNGKGADIDELNSILEDKSNTTSFAIKNVNDRIKHYFGDEYGIRFFNNEDAGVTVIVKFPAVRTMEGLYAKDDNS